MSITRRVLLAAVGVSAVGTLAGAAPQPPARSSPADKELQAMLQSYQKRAQTLYQAASKEKDQKKQSALYSGASKTLYTEFAGRYKALAKKYSGTGAQVQATLMAAQLCQGVNKKDEADQLIGSLVRNCLNLPEMGQAAAQIGYLSHLLGEPKVLGYLETIATRSTLTSVRAGAYFAQAQLHYGFNGQGKAPQKGAQLYRLVAEKFAGTPYAQQAKSALFEVERLQVGMVAPDMTGTDQEGKAFHLADYRGKVVVLDFWGFW